MAATKVYTCDMCGTQRGESNHWFVAYTAIEFTLAPWSALCEPGRLIRDQEGTQHICGQGCAVKHLEKFLNRTAK